jgi:predicted ATPase/class 3 adenylate cyclase
MDFYEVLDQVIDLLQSRKRVAYRALKRQFDLDDDDLEALKDELIDAQRVAVDEAGKVLVWTGQTQLISEPTDTASPIAGHASVSEPHVYTPPHLVEKILTSRSALEGERKQVTVLFCDLANSTGLAEQLGPETMHTILNQFFELALGAVHRYEGTINQFLGDGFMALFGAPIAHEDHARRAVLAALELRRQLQAHNAQQTSQQGIELTIRMGLNTGLVVVGAIGDNLRMDYTAVGDTTNVAARLEQGAAPDQIVMSEATHRLVTGFFEMRDLGKHAIKGHAAPIQTFEVLHTHERRTRLDVLAAQSLTPHIARHRELDTLLELYQQSKLGHGQVISIVGEAGIGKSRHLLEFRRALADRGEEVTWLEGQCLSFGQAIPFVPVVDQLRDLFGIEEADGEPDIIAKVESGLSRIGEMETHLPVILYLLSVDPDDEALTAVAPAARRKRLFDTLLALLRRAAHMHPLVLVYEDLHWIDTSTEAFLGALVDAVVGVPIMLLITYRVGYPSPFGSRSFHTTLSLQNLTESDTLTMASRMLGMEAFPASLQAVLVEKAEGVPLFVEEVVKTLLDTGALRWEHDAYHAVQEWAQVQVPDTIQDIIMSRLDRLGAQGKRAVQLASVIGRQFLVRLLERLSGLSGQLNGLLAELQKLELIYQQGLIPEPAYVFKHAMIQEVAYNSLLERQRKDLHGAVGEAIESLFPERLSEHYEELAHHFAQAEMWEKAMAYSTLSGERAMDAYANAEAKVHFSRALYAAEQIRATVDLGMLARLHAKYGTILMLLGEEEAAVAAYERALEVIQRVGDQPGELEIRIGLSQVYTNYHRAEPATQHIERALAMARALNDPSQQARCLANSVRVRSAAFGQIVETRSDLEEALQLAELITDPKLLAEVLSSLGQTLQWRSEFDRSLVCLRKGVALAQQIHAGLEFGRAAFNLGHVLAAQGDYEDALQWYQQISDYALAADDKFWIARMPNTIAGVYLELYHVEEALQRSLEGYEVAQQFDPWPEPWLHALLKIGLSYLQQQDYAQVETSFKRAQGLLESDTWMRWRVHMALLRAQGEFALIQGQAEVAWTYAQESLELATRMLSRKHMVRAQLLQGDIMASSGQFEEAKDTLHAAIQLAEELQIPREMWLGKAALGKVLMRLGQDHEAESRLTQAMHTINTIADAVQTPGLRNSFLHSAPVQEVYDLLGQKPPTVVS